MTSFIVKNRLHAVNYGLLRRHPKYGVLLNFFAHEYTDAPAGRLVNSSRLPDDNVVAQFEENARVFQGKFS